MNLKISKSSSQPRSAATNPSAAAEILSFATSKSTFGRLVLARSAKGVCAILIDDDEDELEADLAFRFPKAKLVRNEPVVRDDLAKVIRFVDKPREALHSHSICAGRYSTGASGRSFARSLSAGR